MTARWLTIVVCATLACLPGPAWAEGYYIGTAYLTDDHTHLAKIDPASGEVTPLGGAMWNPDRIHGLVMTRDEDLFGMNGWTDALYSIDPVTGQPSWIGPSGYNLAWGLAYSASLDTIFGLGRRYSSDPMRLLAFDRTTGAATAIGPGTTGLKATSGMAWDEANERLIAFDNSENVF